MRFLRGRRIFYATITFLFILTAVNLYVNRTSGAFGLAGVEEMHLRFLGDSSRFEFSLPWVRPAPAMRWVLLFVAALVCVLVGFAQGVLRGQVASAPQRVLLGMLLAVVAITSMESAMQLYVWLNPSEYYGGALLWLMKPNAKSSKMTTAYWEVYPGFEPPEEDVSNSLGLRERELPLEKQPGEFRVVCIGDSWTWGAFVKDTSRWSNRLEKLLQENLPNRKVTVVNAGMAGHTYLQGYLTLTTLGIRYQPDLVIVGWLHDVDGVSPVVDDDVSWLRKGLDRSVTYSVVRSSVGGGLSGTSAHNVYRQRIIDWLAEKKIPTLLVPAVSEGFYPDLPGAVKPEHWTAASPVCGWSENPAPYVIEHKELMIGPPNYNHRTHPSPTGHAYIAGRMADFLFAHSWVLGSPGAQPR